MKAKIFIPLIALALGAFAIPAHAMMLGYINTSTSVEQALNGLDAPVDLYNLANGSLVNLHKTVLQNSGVYKVGNSFYFANVHGVQTMSTSTTTAKTIKVGVNYTLMGKSGSLILVSDDASKGKSFLYNATTKATIKFNLAVNTIYSASFTSDGKVVALLANNSAGKLKLFLSQGSLTTLKELPLPTYAADCDATQISPDGKQLIAFCHFNLPGQIKGQPGFMVGAIKNGAVSSQQRTINNKIVDAASWISATRVISIEHNAGNIFTMTQRDVAAGKVKKSSIIGNEMPLTLGSQAALGIPLEILPSPVPNTFYYTYIVLTTGSPTSYASFIGKFDTSDKTDSTVLNNGTFVFMTES